MTRKDRIGKVRQTDTGHSDMTIRHDTGQETEKGHEEYRQGQETTLPKQESEHVKHRPPRNMKDHDTMNT